MAAAPPVRGRIGSADDAPVLPAAAGSRVSSYAIQFESASFNGAVTIKKLIGDGMTALAIGYKDDATQAVATATITGNAIVLVDCSGGSIVLDCTSYTSGDLDYVAIPLVG